MDDLTYMTQEDVAKTLKISVKTLEAMRQRDDGPLFRKFGRRVLYGLSDIESYLNDHTYRSTSEYK